MHPKVWPKNTKSKRNFSPKNKQYNGELSSLHQSIIPPRRQSTHQDPKVDPLVKEKTLNLTRNFTMGVEELVCIIYKTAEL